MKTDQIPEGYKRCIARMLVRSERWVRRRGVDGLVFTLPPLDVGLIANLDQKTIALLSPTETGRAYLKALDEETFNEATAMQACMVIRELGFPVTDWTESFLAELAGKHGAQA